MATQAGELVDRVLQRVRDTHAAGTPRDMVRRFLTHVQWLVNAKLGLVIADAPFPTVARQGIYPLHELAPTCLRVVGVQEDGRDLTEVKWQEFAYLHRGWLRDQSWRYESFALIGRDLLVLYPARREDSEVVLRVAKRTASLTSDLTDIEVPGKYDPLLVDLATAVVLVRMRTFLSLEELGAAIKERLT